MKAKSSSTFSDPLDFFSHVFKINDYGSLEIKCPLHVSVMCIKWFKLQRFKGEVQVTQSKVSRHQALHCVHLLTQLQTSTGATCAVAAPLQTNTGATCNIADQHCLILAS